MIRLVFLSLLFVMASAQAAKSCKSASSATALTVPGTKDEVPQFSFLEDLRPSKGESFRIIMAVHPKHGHGYVTLKDGQVVFAQNGGVWDVKVKPNQIMRELEYSEPFKGFTSQTEISYKGKRARSYGMYENGDIAFIIDAGGETVRLSYAKAVKAVYEISPKNLRVGKDIYFLKDRSHDFRPGQIVSVDGLTARVYYYRHYGEGGLFRSGGSDYMTVPISRIAK